MSIAPVSNAVAPASPYGTLAAAALRQPATPRDLQEASGDGSDVDALRGYAARFAAPPALTGATAQTGFAMAASPSAPAAPAKPPEPIAALPPLTSSSGSSSSSAFTPARTWASMVGQSGPGGATAGSAADQGMSQILDDGDVFAADAD